MPSVDLRDVTIHYEERGDGEPLLLIMGLGGQLTDWPPDFVDLLAGRFRVVSFDNRDAGLSSATAAPVPGIWSRLRAAVTGSLQPRRKRKRRFGLVVAAHHYGVGIIDSGCNRLNYDLGIAGLR